MLMEFDEGVTSRLLQIFVQDATSASGAGLTGVSYADVGGSWIRQGDSSVTAMTVVDGTVGTFLTESWKEVDSGNMPGVYEVGIPNAVLAAGANWATLYFKGTGGTAANMVAVPVIVKIRSLTQDHFTITNDMGVGGNYTVSGNVTFGDFTMNLINTGRVQMTGGTNQEGLRIIGNGTGNAITLIAGSTGKGVDLTTTANHGVSITATGTSKHGVIITGGNGGTSDGVNLVAGTGGVALRAGSFTVTGNTILTGTTTLTGAVSLGSTLGVTGTVTFNAFTCTNNFTVSGNWLVTGTTTHTGAVANNGGTTFTSGTGDGFVCTTSVATKSGAVFTGNTTGPGVIMNGASGHGLSLVSGLTTGSGLAIGSVNQAGIVITTGAADGILITPTAGHGINIAANGTSKHGIFVTGGTAGTSDGVKFVAGSGGVDMRAAITGALSALSVTERAAIADKILGRNLAGGADGTRTVQDALRFLRNKWSISGTTLTVCAEDDSTTAWTSTLTVNAAADPVTANDPA